MMNERQTPEADVLVVDDTPTILRLLTGILVRRGYKVRVAPDGALALRAAQSAPPDLVLLDIMMPGMDGYEVCEQLKADERTRDIPVIFLSALSETLDKVKAFSVGGVDYITKPFQAEEVLARVATHVSLRGLQRHLQEKNTQLEQEITERKRTEEALRESHQRLEETLAELRATQDRMLRQERLAAVGQLAVGLAHNYNNLMASIVLYSEMMLQTSALSPKDRERLTTIHQQGCEAADLTQQILDFGRRAILQRQALDLAPFMEELVGSLERVLPGSIKLNLTTRVEEMKVNVDPSRLEQAIINLALNARDAMPAGGDLHVALSRAASGDEIRCVACDQVTGEDWVRIAVTDTGTGIPPDALQHIFEPFFTTRAPLGRGLGLAQVYGIVKQHGGHVDVNTKVGEGTTVILYLPGVGSS